MSSPLTHNVVGKMKAGIAGLAAGDEIQVVARTLDKMLRDPIGDAARKERRALLGVSTLAILIGHTGLLPTKIESVGITLTAGHRAAFLWLFVAVVVYFLLAFVIYGLHDFIIYRYAIYATRDEVRERTRSVSSMGGAEPRLWNSTEFGLRISGLRVLWDFAVPILIALYAVVCLVLMIFSGGRVSLPDPIAL